MKFFFFFFTNENYWLFIWNSDSSASPLWPHSSTSHGFVFAVCHSLVLWSAGLGELCTSPKGVGLSGGTLGWGPRPADTARSLGWPGRRQILARCWQVKNTWTAVPLTVLSHNGPVLGPGFITLTLGQCLYNSLELQFMRFTSLKRKQWKYQEPAFV